MAKRKIEEYTFADAYIGSFTRNLMSRKDMLRLASCKDLKSAEAVLQEFGYGEAKELYDDDIEWFIRREQNKLFNLIYDTVPERKELSLCLFPYDYHNIKVCLKSEFLGITPTEDHLMSNGDIDWKHMVAMVRDRNFAFMPTVMKEAIIEATDLFGRSGDPQEIDIILDKACYKQMLQAAEETGEDFLIGIVKRQIDILNLKMFVRLRQMGKPWSFFQKVKLAGGNMSEAFFLSVWEESYPQIADKLTPYGLSEAMAKGGAHLLETGDFALFEKLCDDALMEFNKRAKYESFGIVPIAGYWYAKELEIDNLRIILTGILIGSTPEQIDEKLREPYV